MTENVLKFINKLEGFKTAIKSLHWDSKNLSQHKICDDIADRIAEFQDQVSEVEQSITGKLEINKLKPEPYRITTLKDFVNNVITSTYNFYKGLQNGKDEYIGMRSDVESFLSDMQKNLYLVNFTLKENKKSKKVLKENKPKRKIVRLTESDLHRMVKECVGKILKESHMRHDYYGDGDSFSNTRYLFDRALDADSVEEYDRIMKERDDDIKLSGKLAMDDHNQATPFHKYGDDASHKSSFYKRDVPFYKEKGHALSDFK